MKKVLLTAAAVFAFGFANAQEAKFGVSAGVDFATAKATIDDVSVSASETGFFLGAFVDITVSEKFHVQPELLYVSIEDSGQLQLPILAKFYVGEKFSLLAGPDLLFSLEEKVDGFKSMGIGLDFGASYDINDSFGIEAKYNFGLTNFVEDAPDGVSAKISGLFVGVNYKF